MILAKTVKKEQLESIASAENLKAEISYRFKSISKRFDADLDNLGDYQVLEIHQDRKNIDIEFSSVMEKISDLSSLVAKGGPETELLFKKASRTRDRLSLKREQFFAKLEDVVIQRDITADKMKSASEVTIQLPKFCGYDSKLDVFTFKSEFKNMWNQNIRENITRIALSVIIYQDLHWSWLRKRMTMRESGNA